jgi:phospholipid transport system substrate-binding protein
MCRRKTRRDPWSQRWVILCAVAVALSGMAGASGAYADPATQPPSPEHPARHLIRETIDVVFGILRDSALKNDAKARMAKLRVAVDKAFDWGAMAQSSLGPPWRKLDDKQRAEFVAVFEELLAQQYMDDIDRFQGTEAVQIQGDDQSGDLHIVRTTLITGSREKVPMDYTLQMTSNRWAVVDLSIEGVSLVNHYRETFGRFLVNKDFSELMQQLKRKLGIHE